MNSIKSENKTNQFAWLATWLVIFYSGSAYAASNNTFYAQLKYAIIIGTGIVYLIKTRGNIPLVRNNRKLAVWIPVIWGMLCIINWMVHNDEAFSLLESRILHIIFAYEIVCIVSWNCFKEMYIKSIVGICAISLIFFLLLDNTSLFSALMPKLTGFTEYGIAYTKYQGFLVYFKTNDSRNYGAFWEPGIFATHILCAFLMLPYTALNKNRKIKMYVILVITLLTTASSAGYLLLIIALMCNLTSKFNIKDKRDYIKLVVVFALVALLIGVYNNLETIIRSLPIGNELIFEKMLHISESQRSNSVRVNFDAFLQKPIFGFGFSNLNQAMSYKALGKTLDVVDTATTFRLLAAMGVGGVFFTMILVVGILRNRRLYWFVKIIIVAIAMIIINKEAHDSFLLAWCFSMYLNEKKIDENGC